MVTRRMALCFLVLRTTLFAFSLLTRNVEGQTSSVSTRPTPSPTVSPTLSLSSSESLKSTGISVSEASPATEVFVTNSTSVASQSSARSSAQSSAQSSVQSGSIKTVQPNETTTKTPSTTSGSVGGKSLQFTTTEYVLIACLCVFFVVLITLIVLAVQITRLNKTVGNLKAASHR
ncbi:uncharacterized protein [Montipora capricornis]|uniref:uncharacterized protein n=1 Tax=Montipora capricornis TaxID=246305 RepID=UPI0035F20D54